MNIGDRVRLLREKKGMTQEELATQLGYKSKSSVTHIERGRDIPRSMVAKLADILNTTPAYLMGWEDKAWVMTPDGPQLGWAASQSLNNEIKQNHIIENEAKNLAFIPLYPLKLVSWLLPSKLKEKDTSDIIKFIPYILKENEEANDYIFVNVDNDKMRPMINRDDILLINLKKEILNESLALVTVAAGEGFICRYRYSDNYIEFEYINNIEYPARKVLKSDNDYSRYIPIGVVCKIIKNV